MKYSHLATHQRAVRSQRLGCKYSHPQNHTYSIDWYLPWWIRIEQFQWDWHLVTYFILWNTPDTRQLHRESVLKVSVYARVRRVLQARAHNYPVHCCSKSFYRFIKLIDVNLGPLVSNVHSLACNYTESKMSSFWLCPTLVNHGSSLHCWTPMLNHNPLTVSVLCVA